MTRTVPGDGTAAADAVTAPAADATASAGTSARGLERRALALMTDTAANALLGIVFWSVAARLYTAEEVGRGSALISAATLLTTLAQLNLGNVYARFLGGAGPRQRRLVFGGFGTVAVLGILLGTGYTLLGPTDRLFTSTAQEWIFPFCVAVLAVFVLQDMVLVSLHKAAWVPVENITWGVAKLALLVLMASLLPEFGIGIAWMAPAVLAVVVVNGYLAIRRWNTGPTPAAALPSRRELGRTVGGEIATGLIGTAVPLALPLLVTGVLGAAANAYFSVPWLFATSLSLLMWNVASVLLVETSADPGRRAHLLRRALRLSLAVATAGGTVIWFAGPTLLAVLGPGYADNSSWLLRCAAVSAPAVAVVVVWTTASRAAGRLRRVMAVQAVVGVVMVGVAATLLPRIGVVGVGLGYLAAQWGAALVLLRPLLRMVRPSPDAPSARLAAPVPR